MKALYDVTYVRTVLYYSVVKIIFILSGGGGTTLMTSYRSNRRAAIVTEPANVFELKPMQFVNK